MRISIFNREHSWEEEHSERMTKKTPETDERRSDSSADWLLIHRRHLMSRLIRGAHWSWAHRRFWGGGARGRGGPEGGATDSKRIFCKLG